MNRYLESKTIQLLLGVIVAGILLGLLYKFALQSPYDSFGAYIPQAIAIEFTLFFAIIVLRSVVSLFSRHLNKNAFWHAWLIANAVLLIDIINDWSLINDQTESLAGIEIVFVAPAAILMAITYTLARTQRKSK